MGDRKDPNPVWLKENQLTNILNSLMNQSVIANGQSPLFCLRCGLLQQQLDEGLLDFVTVSHLALKKTHESWKIPRYP